MTHRVVSSNAADEDLIGAIEVDQTTADAETAARFVDAVAQCTRGIAVFPRRDR